MNRKTGKIEIKRSRPIPSLKQHMGKISQRTGKPGANRENPSDAIDFMGWYFLT